MTVEWYDVGLRLAALRSGSVVRRLERSALWPVSRMVAVRAAVRGGRVVVRACVPGGTPATGTGADGLRLLGDLGVRVSGERHTLVTDEPGTIAALRRLAVATREDGLLADVAAHVGWWADRADFPGTSAVVRMTEACSTRWATGEVPEAERRAATWRSWLRVSDDSVAGMFAVVERLQQGQVLPLLDAIADDDEYAWGEACRSHAEGWDWRRPDSISRAASGLRSRCDTADLWASALLEDPLYRRRAVHTGHVVKGQVVLPTTKSQNRMSVTCDRMDARLRAGAQIVGWAAGGGGVRFSGSVTGTGVEGGRLMLGLLVTAASRPTQGARVTLMPAPHDVRQAQRGRRQYRSLYSTRTSWLTTGRTPTPQRRDVPLDVLLAGASGG